MAGRSDFISAALPRQLKRMIAMGQAHGFISNDEHAAFVREAFVSAHRTHKAFRTQRKLPVEAAANGTEE